MDVFHAFNGFIFTTAVCVSQIWSCLYIAVLLRSTIVVDLKIFKESKNMQESTLICEAQKVI